MANNNEGPRTKKELLLKAVLPERSPVKYLAELDINGDSLNDLILSKSISLAGTGGLIYDIYLARKDGKYNQVGTFVGSMVSLEVGEESKARKLWVYSHGSARSGSVFYFYFDREAQLKKSRAITIHSSAQEIELGDKLLETIFNKQNKVTFRKFEAPKY